MSIGGFKPIQSFDGLTPQTTKGDLIGRTTVGATRIPVGADGLFLKADSSTPLGVVYASPAGANVNLSTLTGATTLTTGNDIVLVSGTTFAVTLPTTIGNAGKVFEITKIDAGLVTPISIVGTSLQTINGQLGLTLSTQWESYTLAADGLTGYVVRDHTWATDWSASTGISVSAITTAPTKGASILVDSIRWSRVGAFAHVYGAFQQATGGTGGSGNYLINLPANLTFSSTFVSFYTTLIAQNLPGRPTNSVGTCFMSYGNVTNEAIGVAAAYDATSFRLFTVDATNSNVLDAASNYGMAGANCNFNFTLRFQVPGWGS